MQRKVVRSTGFASFVSASSGDCAGQGQALLAVSTTGRIHAFYDADGWWATASSPVGRVAATWTIPVPTYSN